MGEAASTGGPAVSAKRRGADEIRSEIEQTREELGDTVEALAAKTDVKARAKAKVEDTKDRARATVDAVKERVEPASGGFPDLARATPPLRRAAESPGTYVAIAAVTGVLLGLLLARG